MRLNRRSKKEDAELDITSFMNLMIVLVPVLLLSLVFSQVRILNLQLPVTATSAANDKNDEIKLLELVISNDKIIVNYPSGVPLKEFNAKTSGKADFDFAALSRYLQDIKLTFQQKNIIKSDAVLLLQANVNYQTIITTMDTVRSFKAVVAASLVDAELFPNISLGDAPEVVSEGEQTVKEGLQ